MRGSGGTAGGWGRFAAGWGLLLIGLWLFFDSVRVLSAGHGMISGMIGGMGGGGMGGGLWDTTSMGVVFLPLLVGVAALAYDASQRWARWLVGAGVAILVIEMLSRIRFFMNLKTTSLLIMLAAMAAGLGLILSSYRDLGEGPY